MDASDYSYGGRHSWGWGHHGDYDQGCAGLGCLMLLQGFRGSLTGTLCTVAALGLTYLAWNWEFLEGPGTEDYGLALGLLLHPAIWTLILGAAVGYVAAVTTDRYSKTDSRDSWEP